MYAASKEVLTELVSLLMQEKAIEIYAIPVPVLRNGTIGQHIRHIIELYICLLDGYDEGHINYDKRKRDMIIETSPAAALEKIQFITDRLEKPDKPIVLQSNINNDSLHVQSSYCRELLYNFEHCIHHQALIQAALIALQQEIVPENFGVAPSTLQYRKQCAQ